MENNYVVVNIDRVTDKLINEINQYFLKYPNRKVALNLKNTKYISLYDLTKLEGLNNSNNVFIRIIGGYDDERVKNYPAPVYEKMHKYDNIYSISETKQILRALEKIDSGINPIWSDEQKLLYFVGYLKNKIIYHPFHETVESKDIRSLRGLISRKTVCAGYALILKEICDRNGIDCQYVEGVCNEKDRGKHLSHAWNIVNIQGTNFPIDVTWNAGKSNRGRALSMMDLANVNEFVKKHFPGTHEKIQDYTSELKSIDGAYLTQLNLIINRDMTYDLRTYYGRHADGSKFKITQLQEFVRENQYVYRYVYTKQLPNEKYGIPVIFYSSTNVAEIMSIAQNQSKLKKQLKESIENNNVVLVNKIKAQMQKNEGIDTVIGYVVDLLFSKENLMAAMKRNDFYIGEINTKEIENSNVGKAESLTINPVFGKKINLQQKRFQRSDGTSFVIETYGVINLGNRNVLYRYRMYENIMENGIPVIKMNTIFTDRNILIDNRQVMIDDFLSRSIIDRESREAGGYLGYYTENNVRTYNESIRQYFSNYIYKKTMLNQKNIRDYYKELTFDDMKRLAYMYKSVEKNGQEVIVNRFTGRELKDNLMILHVKFALIWLNSAGIKWSRDEEVFGYKDAYESELSKKIFMIISKFINDSINISGNIDTIEIFRRVMLGNGTYFHAKDVVLTMFGNIKNLEVINEIYRMRSPSSLKEKVPMIPLVNDATLMSMVLKRNKELLEEQKSLLEVVKEDSRVTVKPIGR